MRLQETSPRPSHATLATTHFQPRTSTTLTYTGFQPITYYITYPFVCGHKKGPVMYQSPYVIKPTSFIMLSYRPVCHSYYYHNENPLYVSNLYMVGITQLYGYVYLGWMYHYYPFELVVYHLVSPPL